MGSKNISFHSTHFSGELSTDDIQPNEYVERYIFFAVFLFVMPLVLFTLMNALAVTDTTVLHCVPM